jgi:hypothetical protein
MTYLFYLVITYLSFYFVQKGQQKQYTVTCPFFLVMQGQPILESPHFMTGTVVILLLTINAVIAATGFIGNQATARTVHAYVGSTALLILVAHAVLGLQLGLSI